MHGIFISIAILAPNVLMLTNPPQDVPPKAQVPKAGAFRWFETLERLGQVGCFVIPLVYLLTPHTALQWAAVAVMVLALAFYYAGWIRFMRGGYRFRLLFAPMAGVPVPMASAPVVYFFAASVALASVPLAVAAALLAVGHLYVSRFTWNHIKNQAEEAA